MTDTNDEPQKKAPLRFPEWRAERDCAGRFLRTSGRPKGARSKTTLAMESLLQGEAERLTRAAIALALQGDVAALRLCLDRLYPVPKDRPLPREVEMPRLERIEDAARATAEIAEALADGRLSPREAGSLLEVVRAWREAAVLQTIEDRLSRLEEAAKQ